MDQHKDSYIDIGQDYDGLSIEGGFVVSPRPRGRSLDMKNKCKRANEDLEAVVSPRPCGRPLGSKNNPRWANEELRAEGAHTMVPRRAHGKVEFYRGKSYISHGKSWI